MHLLTKPAINTLLGITLSVTLGACSSSTPPPEEPQPEPPTGPNTGLVNEDPCSVSNQNQWVYDNMLDYYLYYDQVPNVDPANYESPGALLSDVRFQERDPFSNLRNQATSALAFEEGREFHLGYRWNWDSNGIPRVIGVMTESPFGQAGIKRGDILVSINGIPWATYWASDDRFDPIGTPEAPVTSTFEIQERETGNIISHVLMPEEYKINTVLASQRLTSSSYSGEIGYLAFNRFLEPSVDELAAVFANFKTNNITDLVLDLRYNGGGRISTARFLASLIAGDSRGGEALVHYEHNDKYTNNNYSYNLYENLGGLDLNRLIVLTRSGTASASELVISGLQPHMEVVTIGTTTRGKPYISSGRTNCGQVLNAMEAQGVNDAGVSVYGGIPATCYAVDDRERDFGFNNETGEVEGMLLSALSYIIEGHCATAPTADLQARSMNSGRFEVTEEMQGMVDTGGAIH